MVDPVRRRVDPKRFTNKQAELLRFAALDPRVARIFVNPAIKLALCERPWVDRSWLRLIRPWNGHDAHFHIRLNCPADQPACIPQDPPPHGDGCGDDLDAWLSKPAPAARPPHKEAARPTPSPPAMPLACLSVLGVPPQQAMR